MTKQKVLSVGTLAIAAAGAAGLLMLGTSNAATAGVVHKQAALPADSWDDDDDGPAAVHNKIKNENEAKAKNKNWIYNKNEAETSTEVSVSVSVGKNGMTAPR